MVFVQLGGKKIRLLPAEQPLHSDTGSYSLNCTLQENSYHTMSFRYRKVIPDGFFFKTYGFQRVSPAEMEDIVKRLQKQTQSSEFVHSERNQASPSPPRPPSSICRRAESARSEIRNPSTRPRQCYASPAETDVMFRRIRKATVSYRAALGRVTPSYETENKRKMTAAKAPLPKEQAKSIVWVSRPTSAFKYRTGEGSRHDPDIVKYQNYDFSDDKRACERELHAIIDRVRAPTIASEGGVGPMCPRRRDSIGRSARPSKDLPLVSGLPRSPNIETIVDRLSRPGRVCRPSSAMQPGRRRAVTPVQCRRRIRSAATPTTEVRVQRHSSDKECSTTSDRVRPCGKTEYKYVNGSENEALNENCGGARLLDSDSDDTFSVISCQN